MYINMREKKSRQYFINYFTDITMEDVQKAKTPKQIRKNFEIYLNTIAILEQFIKEDEEVSFNEALKIIENAPNTDFKMIRIEDYERELGVNINFTM